MNFRIFLSQRFVIHSCVRAFSILRLH